MKAGAGDGGEAEAPWGVDLRCTYTRISRVKRRRRLSGTLLLYKYGILPLVVLCFSRIMCLYTSRLAHWTAEAV